MQSGDLSHDESQIYTSVQILTVSRWTFNSWNMQPDMNK